MSKLGFSLLFAILFTCNGYSSSEQLNGELTEDTFEHETMNVEDVGIMREGSLETHEDHKEYSMEGNVDELGDADDNENYANMNDYEGSNVPINRRRWGLFRCGQRTYNPRFAMCCNGNLVGRSGLSSACCGTRAYDLRFHMCCGGNIVDRPGRRPACCGTRGYILRFSMCCGGSIVRRLGFSFACCGTRGYNLRFTMCCGDNIVSRSGFRSPACCGTRGYDLRSSMCCSGNIVSKWAFRSPACCGRRGYDLRSSKCCSGQVRQWC